MLVVGWAGSSDVGARAFGADHHTWDRRAAGRPAVPPHPRLRWPGRPAAALAPGGVAPPRTPRLRSDSDWLADAPRARLGAHVQPRRSAPATPAAGDPVPAHPYAAPARPIGQAGALLYRIAQNLAGHPSRLGTLRGAKFRACRRSFHQGPMLGRMPMHRMGPQLVLRPWPL